MTTTEDALASRLQETESRLSADLWAAAISRKVRRFVIVGGIAAFLSLTALVAVIAVQVHVNNALQQQSNRQDQQTQSIMRALHSQSMSIMHTIRNTQITNAQRIAQIESVVDPSALATATATPASTSTHRTVRCFGTHWCGR